eukprot:CAMPEP_0176440844 /NCGR_PEP_ID=MMETSP0127-20121128/20822_1 /TAXON_ID=938130 /ORGANISM="Platyophrya macrostoma, Strain WH" /LENGTH=309 /DNA_ID=CAMNT_0017825465 /DNA_START=22 /DNA_END=951 /DNA_ORIENTATION=+
MNGKTVCGIICLVILLIVGAVLFGVSFGVVQTSEYGIVYDHNWQTIHPGYKTSGRYLVGLGKSFVTYPRTVNLVQLSTDPDAQGNELDCWSSDGVTIYIEISFYYALVPDKLVDLFFEYGDNWYAVVLRHSQAALRNAATSFSTSSYLQQRTTISQAFTDALNAMFQQKFLGGATVYDFQLRKISFDAAFDTVLTAKIAQLQAKNTTEILRTSTLIDKGTEKIKAIANNQIALINAQATAQGQVNVSIAKANLFNQTVTQYAVSYYDLFTTLGVTNTTEKLHLIYSTEISQMANAGNTVVGTQNVLVTI